MAEPARQLDNEGEPDSVYDAPGTAPSSPTPNLKKLEGGGETTEPKTGHLSEAGGENPSRDELAKAENSSAAGQLGPLGKGYTGAGAVLDRFTLKGFSRRRAMFGGGLIGTIIALVMFFTFASGPFQFIHIAQLLEQFHFAGLQSQQDDRFTKEVRLFRFASKGEIEKTRLSFLGNKFADKFETKLNASGLESSYSKTFGLFDGYVVDESSEKFKNMDREQIKQYVKENYGVDAVDGGSIKGSAPEIKGKLVIDASNLGYIDNYKLTYGLLRESGYSKLSSAIGARYLCQRAACTSMLHPLTKKVGGSKRSLEDWWNNRNTAAKEGGNSSIEGDTQEQQDKNGKTTAQQDKLKTEIATDESSKLSPKDISLKLGSVSFAAAGILCIAKSADSQAKDLKAGQIQVLMRLAVESMGIGSQIQSGQDIDMSQLAQYDSLLSGTDSSGNKTSWADSESIQANLGKAKTGVAPDKTLTTVTNDGTPFDFVRVEPLKTALDGVCSTAGQAISILTGGIEGLVVAGASTILIQQTNLATDLAKWLAGNAVDVDAVGADFGNEIDYGAALASNAQAMLAGGSALSSSQAAALQSTTNTLAQEQFNNQSIPHKLFSPYDNQSLISKLIDSSSTSPKQNLAKMGSMLLNVKGVFSSIANLFGGHAHAAASTGYNYGFPTYGFSQADMTNPAYANPYSNACYVVGCSEETQPNGSQPIVGFLTGSSVDGAPASPTGQAYITRAEQCFGVLISQATVQTDSGPQTQWDVTSSSGDLPNPYDSSKYPNNCADLSDQNWTRLRFFILDTETMNSMGCYAGDGTACTDIGFDSASDVSSDSTNTTNSGSGAIDQGTGSELAQKILNYRSTGQYNCDNPGDCVDLQKVANGQSIQNEDDKTNAWCEAQTLDPRVLKLILYMIENGYKIGTTALCGDHGFDSSGGHSGGFAVDIGSINGLALSQDSPAVAAIGVQMDKFLNNLPSDIKLDQQISYGYGEHYYAPMAALQQAQGKLCQDTCVSFYTQSVEDEHTNHIHAGF